MSKASKKPSQTPPAPPTTTRKPLSLIVASVAVLGLGIAALVFMQSEGEQPAPPVQAASAPSASSAPAAPATSAASQAPATLPPDAYIKPHTQKEYPPLQMPGYPLGRSPEVITAAYKFAAEHPEVLTFVPCFCGCERGGHKGNEDCFVKTRADNGDVVEWEEHGMECNVCLDVAQQAMQMHASGASVRDIRKSVEAKWSGQFPGHTHTPEPPK
jgi:Protein of unknown function with PCYCGC motif